MTREAFERAAAALPLVAILRGLVPAEAEEVGRELAAAGFRLIEVPLNSPDPFASIATLARALGPEVMVGAGTVLEPGDAARIAAAGGRLLVMPHGDPAVIRAGKRAGLVCLPGVATPTEGFAALAAGADALKLFPAETLGTATLRAWRAVFPPSARFFPVGGITPDTLKPWQEAGAAGFGLGSALFRPGMDAAEVGRRARAFPTAWRQQEGPADVA